MFDKITTFLGPKVGLARLTLREKQPEIFLAGGIGLGVLAAVKLAQAHKGAEEIFQDVRGEIEGAKEVIRWNNEDVPSESGDVPNDWAEITPIEKQKVLLPLYVETARLSAIVYGPSVLIGVGALAMIITSHRSLKARNRALMAMAAVLERSFSKYRERVQLELGEEADQRFYYGAESRTVNTITVGKDGKKRKGKKETKNHIPEEADPIMYQRIYDRYNPNWNDNDDMNLWTLTVARDYFELKLSQKGWVTLNQVYKYLGFEETGYGQMVGWSLNDNGDHYIDFGLDDDINQREGDPRYYLDFNVSGNIVPLIEKKK